MRKLFNPCINDVVGLIEAQMKQLGEALARRVKVCQLLGNLFGEILTFSKSVLLVGGFGASAYLQGRLEEALKLRKIKMHRPDPDKSWTAVVQGAVSPALPNFLSRITSRPSTNIRPNASTGHLRYRKGMTISRPLDFSRVHGRDYQC